MMHKKNWRRYIFFPLVILLILCFHIFWYIFRYQDAALQEMRWEHIPNLLTIDGVEREGQHGMLFLRLQDGKEQFLAGQWQVNFTDNGDAYVFGEFPPHYSKQQGQSLYLFDGSERIYNFEFSGLNGKIQSVQENPKGTYLLIEVQREKNTSFCVTAKHPEQQNKKKDCDQINTPGRGTALWNSEKERELVIKDDKENIFVFDPWESTPQALNPQKEPERVLALQALFQETNEKRAQKIIHEPWKLHKILDIAFLQKGKKWSFFPVPIFSHIAWLSDGNHILVKEFNAMTLLEISTWKKTEFFTGEKLLNKKIQFRNYAFDQTL